MHPTNIKMLERLKDFRSKVLLSNLYPYANLRQVIEDEVADSALDFCLVDHIVEQAEDLFDLLIGSDRILKIELSRISKSENPVSVEWLSLKEYRRGSRLSKHTNKLLYLALKLNETT